MSLCVIGTITRNMFVEAFVDVTKCLDLKCLLQLSMDGCISSRKKDTVDKERKRQEKRKNEEKLEKLLKEKRRIPKESEAIDTELAKTKFN